MVYLISSCQGSSKYTGKAIKYFNHFKISYMGTYSINDNYTFTNAIIHNISCNVVNPYRIQLLYSNILGLLKIMTIQQTIQYLKKINSSQPKTVYINTFMSCIATLNYA